MSALGFALLIGVTARWTGSPTVAICGLLVGWMALRERRRSREARRARSLLDQLTRIVDHLSLATRSGESLSAAVADLGADRDRFGRPAIGLASVGPMVDAVRSRRPAAEAASLLLTTPDRPVRLIGATLQTVARTGGPVGPALARLRHTLAGAVHGEERRRAESTQALASAAMLSTIPVGFALLAAVADRQIANFYLHDRGGTACLVGALGLGYGGWVWMRRQVDRPAGGTRRQPRRRGDQEAAALDDLVGTVELTAAVIGSGGTVGAALAGLAEHGPERVAPAFARVVERRRNGLLLADALAPASHDLGPAFHPFVGALLVSASGGAPVGLLLQRLGDDADAARRRSVEVRARRLSVTLLPPLVLCHLPALVLGALAPVVIVAIGRLGR